MKAARATPVGRIALSVLLFQDLMVAPALFVTGVLGRADQHVALTLAGALLQAVAAVVVIAGVGRYLLRPVFRLAGRTGSRELILAMSLFMVIGCAAATGRAGLSTALGAFLAGLLLSETEYRHQVEIDLAPFKGMLIGEQHELKFRYAARKKNCYIRLVRAVGKGPNDIPNFRSSRRRRGICRLRGGKRGATLQVSLPAAGDRCVKVEAGVLRTNANDLSSCAGGTSGN